MRRDCRRHARETKRKPEPKYLLTVFDSLLQVVACVVTDYRDADSVERVIRLAVERSGTVPRILGRDGAPIYDKARGRLGRRLRGTRWVTAHFKTLLVPHILTIVQPTRRRPVARKRRQLAVVTQNHTERYHCLPHARENSMRGVKKADSGTAYFQVLAAANYLFNPHAFHGGNPPGEDAGWSPGLKWAGLTTLL